MCAPHEGRTSCRAAVAIALAMEAAARVRELSLRVNIPAEYDGSRSAIEIDSKTLRARGVASSRSEMIPSMSVFASTAIATRPCRDTCCDCWKAPAGDRQGARPPRSACDPCRPRHGSSRQLGGRIRRRYQIGHRQMGQGDQGSGYQARLTRRFPGRTCDRPVLAACRPMGLSLGFPGTGRPQQLSRDPSGMALSHDFLSIVVALSFLP